MKTRVWTLPLAVMLMIVMGSGFCLAIPSLGGPTGIVTTPNALVAPTDELQTAISYQSMEVEGLDAYTEDLTAWTLQVLGGISDQAELWAAYSSIRNCETTSLWGVGGKFQVTQEPTDAATVAIGGSLHRWRDAISMYEGGDLTDLDAYKAYIVATKDMTPIGEYGSEWAGGSRVLGSAGLMYISLDADSLDESLTRPFVGVEFIGGDGTTLGLEYRWKDSDLDCKAVFSAVLRHQFSPAMCGEIGVTNADPLGLGLDDQDFFMRIGYDVPLGVGGY